MEMKNRMNKLTELYKKYKYALLVIAIGIGLMLIPIGKEGDKAQVTDYTTLPTVNEEEKLAEILTQIQGAGKVRVMLSHATGQQTVYQTDADLSVSEGSSDSRSDTVTVTDSQRGENGLICQVNPPTYLGAIVVCEGADSPQVKLSIVDAVSKITGLGADRITVLKMK